MDSNQIKLSKLGTFKSEDGAEIVAHDPATQRLFVTTGDTIEVIDISDPANPTKVNDNDIDVTSIGGGANSVAVKNGIVAVAVEGNTKQDNGKVAFYNTNGELQGSVTVGPLPDMLTFTPDGMKVIVANEGEPNDAYDNDPEGSISIIDISGGVDSLTDANVKTADFTAFNDRKQELINKGVKIFGQRADGTPSTVAEDLEPEYIAVSPDGSTALVTLQENNAVAVVDIETAAVKDVLPLGVKDHSKGQPTVTNYEVQGLGPIANGDGVPLTTPAGQTIDLGGISGLYYAGQEGDKIKFVSVPDRGPNPDTFKEDKNGDGTEDTVRPLALPDYQARIVEIELDTTTGVASVSNQIFLTRNEDGVSKPITGAPNFVFDVDGNQVDEFPVDAAGNPVDLDPFGGDLEGIVIDGDGNYWMVDEYRPAIYHFDSDGVLLNRFIPEGTATLAGQAEGTFGTETLPAEYANRRRNRGFEAIALDADEGILYSFIQTPLANPDRAASDASDVIRILGINPATGEPVAEYVYLLEDSAVRSGGRVDKIGDAVYVGDGKFQVIERDSEVGENAKKFIFEIDLKGATNLLADDAPSLIADKTLEQHTADELVAQGINPVHKTKVTNLPSIGYQAGDKPEGLALLPDGRLAVINDNDFGLLDETIPEDGSGTVAINPNPTKTILGLIDFPEGNQLDASNRDVDGSKDAGGKINIQNHPVFGLYQPDAIDSFEVDGKTYYITANEGDARIRPDGDDILPPPNDEEGSIFNEEARIGDDEVILDPTVFPNADELKENENLGRLKITNKLGDLDGDGDFDKLFNYGGRSFSIWDEFGNQVFDSGDQIAKILEKQTQDLFNADFDDELFDADGNLDFSDTSPSFEQDGRSDDKGAEPESVTVGKINGKPYGFVGLERAGGGVMVYDLSNPTAPEFVQYIRTEGDVAPEGLKFIAPEDSPNGNPVLAVANEVSKTTTLYDIEVPNYTLQILHASDLEGGVEAIDSAANFAAIVDKFEDEVDNSITLSAGDNYIPGPFFGAAGDRSLRTPLQEFYKEFFDINGLTNIREGVGRVDMSIMNAIGFDASAVGNHEFDAGTNAFGDIIGTDIRGNTLGDARWLGAQFPYLSANLDFSGDSNLADLYTEEILPNTDFQSLPTDLDTAAEAPKIAPATIIEENGEKIGVVGATTQLVETISSTGGVDVIDPESNDMAELAKILQPTIDKLIADGINKVIVVSHLQQIALEKELIGLLSGVDVIIAGGSDTLQADSNDRLREGDTAAEDYPFKTTNKDDDPAVIVSTNGEYSYVGRLVVDFDLEGKVILDSIVDIITIDIFYTLVIGSVSTADFFV
ncbi:MAG: esterase-like activity of phytase family protein, partial [Cyanobacteria bacterium J06639_18]